MEKIGIVGSGLIGRAWATVFARAGHAVIMYDADTAALPKAAGLIRDGLRELKQFGLISEAPETVAARVRTAGSLAECVRDVDYVQENTAERLEIKREVYAQMDAAARPDCILASSTSTIETSRFADGLKGKQRCLVAHPVNPPHIVPIVEISPAPFTSPEV